MLKMEGNKTIVITVSGNNIGEENMLARLAPAGGGLGSPLYYSTDGSNVFKILKEEPLVCEEIIEVNDIDDNSHAGIRKRQKLTHLTQEQKMQRR